MKQIPTNRSNHLSLKYHDAADAGVLVDLDDGVRPIRIQRLEILAPALDDELLEGCLRCVFQHHDDIFSMDRLDVGVDEDQIAVVELGLHADTVQTQDISLRTAFDRAGEEFCLWVSNS